MLISGIYSAHSSTLILKCLNTEHSKYKVSWSSFVSTLIYLVEIKCSNCNCMARKSRAAASTDGLYLNKLASINAALAKS